MTRVEVIETALRSFDYIDVANAPGEDEDYRRIALAIEQAIAESEAMTDG